MQKRGRFSQNENRETRTLGGPLQSVAIGAIRTSRAKVLVVATDEAAFFTVNPRPEAGVPKSLMTVSTIDRRPRCQFAAGSTIPLLVTH